MMRIINKYNDEPDENNEGKGSNQFAKIVFHFILDIAKL